MNKEYRQFLYDMEHANETDDEETADAVILYKSDEVYSSDLPWEM